MAKAEVIISTPTADALFVNGKVATVNCRDEIAEALSIRGKRILRVGNRPYVEQTVGPNTKEVDLKGRTLVPGFIENHIHMTNSPQRRWIDCSYAACPSISDIAEKIAARTRVAEPGEWILGRGFQSARLKDGRNPNRFDLDPISPNNPVGIANREGMGWTFNTLGLRRIGVEDERPIHPAGRWSATSRPAARPDVGQHPQSIHKTQPAKKASSSCPKDTAGSPAN